MFSGVVIAIIGTTFGGTGSSKTFDGETSGEESCGRTFSGGDILAGDTSEREITG